MCPNCQAMCKHVSSTQQRPPLDTCCRPVIDLLDRHGVVATQLVLLNSQQGSIENRCGVPTKPANNKNRKGTRDKNIMYLRGNEK